MKTRAFMLAFLSLIFLISLISADLTNLNQKKTSQESIQNLENSVKDLNSQILDTKDQYRGTFPFRFQERNQISENAVKIAKKRKNKMLELAEKEPQRFLAKTLTEQERKQIPKNAKKHIEKKVSTRGKVNTRKADDFTNPERPKVSYKQHIKKGDRKIEIESQNPRRLIGRKEVPIKGYRLNDTIVLSKVNRHNIRQPGPQKESRKFPENLMTGNQIINFSDFAGIGNEPVINIENPPLVGSNSDSKIKKYEKICEDEDGDGYYNQTKRCRLPIDAEKTLPDCDDSDPQIGGSKNCDEKEKLDIKEDRKPIKNPGNIEIKSRCEWTKEIIDVDNPSGKGDYETLENARDLTSKELCDNPNRIRCKAKMDGDWVNAYRTGENITCSPEKGVICKDKNQIDGKCDYDYGFRLGCGIMCGKPSCPANHTYINGTCSRERNLGIILVNFKDSKPKPFTRKEAHERIFNGPFQNFYRERSYGKTHFTGDVFGWNEIDMKTKDIKGTDFNYLEGGCDLAWQDKELEDYIIRKKINVSKYDHLLTIVNGKGCGSGISTIGKERIEIAKGKYKVSSSVASMDRGPQDQRPKELKNWGNLDFLISHEIGHAIKLPHARSYDCGDKTLGQIGKDCEKLEYGNHYDVMGRGQFSLHLNANYKERFLDWIKKEEILEINSSGKYTIGNLEGDSSSKAAKIKMPGQKNQFYPYHIEYRVKEGFDKLLDNNGSLLIYKSFMNPDDFERHSSKPLLLENNPKALYYEKRFRLRKNEKFNDSSKGIKIGPITKKTKDKVTFKVNLNQKQKGCNPKAPGIVIRDKRNYNKKASTIKASPGDNVPIKNTYINMDNIYCEERLFNFSIGPKPSVVNNISSFYGFPTIYKLNPQNRFKEKYSADPTTLNISSSACNGTYKVPFKVERLNEKNWASLDSNTKVTHSKTKNLTVKIVNGTTCPIVSNPRNNPPAI